MIKYKDKYCIGNLNEFKEKKRKEIEFSLKQALQSLSNPDCYRAHINDTNGRLDSTLTNLWSEFKGQILHDNDCCEIDIVNSQMAFLAYHLKGVPNYNSFSDVKRFISLAESGIVYDDFADLLKIDRSAAKQILFHVLFSDYKTNDISISKFKSMFPNIYDYIREWKKTNGSNYFSVMLQKMESETMINCVLKELIQRNIYCLTVHDSVICRKGQVKEVMDIMQDIFKQQNFKCELYSKYYEMEKKEKRENRLYYPDAPNQADRIFTDEELTFPETEEEREETELIFKNYAEKLKNAAVPQKPETHELSEEEIHSIEDMSSDDDDENDDEDEYQEIERWWEEFEDL